MILEYINAYSAGVIALWATWCILSGKVRDGVVGKIIYAVIALSGYSILARNERMFFSPTIAGTTLYVSLALAGTRHWFMVMYWPQTKAWLCRKLHCEHCLRCDRTTGGVEQPNK
ncbi:hypothetical protein [Pseudomonas versuta]|uniref:Uncharacterized protein n=1 Tax=Pseudomonas versuta TaxID=1788301 RepID=A0ABX3E6M4_9PSED|nr:hypothetical protein [Pseudomonas versuta]ALE88031.1 hypothetical protein AOC04_07360 [Pseudomonas versuta]OKA20767.1 hypothetical protein BOH73_13090 [Pseudomonas versuta]